MFSSVLCVLLAVLAADPSSAKSVEKPDYDHVGFYLRILTPEGKKTPRELQTVIARFTGPENLEVDLVGAIHVGDKAYYEELNKRFKDYDVVLYELVADEGERVDKKEYENRKGDNPLSMFQNGMGDTLGLKHQLQIIDYTPKNFVHADLSPEEFVKKFGERGDLLQIFIRSLLLSMKRSSDSGTVNDDLKMQGRILGSFFASDPSLPLKRNVAKLMADQMRDGTWILGGEGSAIITDRNAACLKKLRSQIRQEKKKIAIFYGCAHLPEFAKSLEKEFKLRYSKSDWITAWNMK